MITRNLDADLDNADWTKTTWDLPIHDLASLRAYLRAQGTTVAEFKERPVYRFNVDKLEWLQGL